MHVCYATFGVVHVVVAPLDQWDVWAEIFDRGPWQTLTLDDSRHLAYSEAFWVAPGSFGVPVLLLGASVLWATRRGLRVPAPFGWAMTAWGALLVALLPASPAWALLVVGLLLVVVAHGPDTDEAGVPCIEQVSDRWNEIVDLDGAAHGTNPVHTDDHRPQTGNVRAAGQTHRGPRPGTRVPRH